MATEFEFKVTGVPAVARALADMRNELDAVARKHDFLAAAQRNAVPAVDSFNQQVSRSTAAAAAGNRGFVTLAKAAKTLTPAMSGIAASAAGSAGAMGTLAASFGPVGIGVGILLTAFGLARKAMEEADAAIGGIAHSADIARQSFEDLLSAIQKADQAAALQSRIDRGGASSQEYRAQAELFNQEVNQLKVERQALRQELLVADGNATDINLRIRAVGQRIEELRALRAGAMREAGESQAADNEGLVDDRGGGRGGGGSRLRSGRVDDGGFMGPGSETLADLDAEESAYQSSLGLAETNKSAETIAGRADLLNEQMALARAKDEEALTIQREAQADALARQNEELASQQELLKGIGSNMMALGVGIFEQGPKKAFKAWAKQFAIQQGGLAIEALAMAAPLLLTPGGQATGGAYLERAALHGAAAAAVGAAGAATGGGSRRGGGGGGARPEQPSSMAGQSGPAVPNQITVHINSPVPESELGRMNARAAQEAERRFGR
jgi:hypothetical protein